MKGSAKSKQPRRGLTWKGKLLLLAFIAVLLPLSGCTASGTCKSVTVPGIGGWEVLAGLALVISFFIVGMAYMLGEFIKSAAVVAWARQEFFQAMVSVAIASLIIVAANALCVLNVSDFMPIADTVVTTQVGIGPGDNYFSAAEKYLVWLRNSAYGTYAGIRNTIGGMEVDASRSRYVCNILCWIGLQGYSMDPYVGYYTTIGVLMQYMSTITLSLLSAMFMLHVLKYIQVGMFNVLLPVGIVFRSLPFMRGFGGALISMVVAMFFFYPLMLVLNAFVWAPIAAYPLSGSGGYSGYFELSAALVVGTVFLPALNFVVIIAGARELSRVLGEEIDISRLAQMV